MSGKVGSVARRFAPPHFPVGAETVIASAKRLILALVFVLPVAALVAPPAMAKQQTTTQGGAQSQKSKTTKTQGKSKKQGTQKVKTKKPTTNKTG